MLATGMLYFFIGLLIPSSFCFKGIICESLFRFSF